MKSIRKVFGSRRWFLGGVGTAAGLAVGVAAQAQQATAEKGPMRHAEDAWLDELPTKHRVFIDTSTTSGGANALAYASNILGAHREDYQGQDSDYGMVICYRHQSTPFAYGDEIWAKYGEVLSKRLEFVDPKTNKPFTTNPLNIPNRLDLGSRGITIDSVVSRGVKFAICKRATRGMAFMIANELGKSGTSDEIYQEILNAPIAAGRFVAAGVVATTRAQEYGYSLLYSA